MDIGYILGLIVVGLVIGALARLIVPGPNPIGIIGTILVGLGGAIGAGLVTHYLFNPREDWVGFVIAVLCAAVLVAIFGRPRGIARY